MNHVRDQFYYVYLLQSQKNSKWYTEYTGDLQKRFKQHQAAHQPIRVEEAHLG